MVINKQLKNGKNDGWMFCPSRHILQVKALQELIYDHIDLPSEVIPFLKGVRVGAGYAISLILTGKLDLTLLEIDTNQGSEDLK